MKNVSSAPKSRCSVPVFPTDVANDEFVRRHTRHRLSVCFTFGSRWLAPVEKVRHLIGCGIVRRFFFYVCSANTYVICASSFKLLQQLNYCIADRLALNLVRISLRKDVPHGCALHVSHDV